MVGVIVCVSVGVGVGVETGVHGIPNEIQTLDSSLPSGKPLGGVNVKVKLVTVPVNCTIPNPLLPIIVLVPKFKFKLSKQLGTKPIFV